ncbi:hypothetical protein, partial [Streptomyces misionensis]|uniref:hypothetical protein n=1 Tax=Streptomyces misionensis TaxID=67331 RepID=UPI0036B608DD
GDVVGLVLIEYSYAPDGSIAGVRLVDAVTGDTYTPQGEVTTCPAGVEQPERDLIQLCDLTDAESGAGLLQVQFLRDYQRDENGQITGHTDYTLDGAPYVPTGMVGVCPQESTCRDCTTHVLCDAPASTVTAPILNPPQPPAGARSGTLPNDVGWEVYGGSSSVPNWWSIALLPSPSAGPLPVRFTQPVTAEWSAQVGRRGVGVGIIVMPPGTQLVSLDPAHLWDPATRVFRPDPASGPVGAGAPTSRFRHPGPVTELLFATDGSTGFSATQRMVGDFLVTPATVPFLRTVCRDCDGQVLTTTDTLLDGITPYEPVGTVGVCHPPETEPCASTVDVLRLCDLNPDAEPDEQGRRCAVPFLRHLVHDCTGVLVETRDTGMDGATPYTPVQVVDCGSGGVPALTELLWPQTGIAEDPAGVARQDFVYTITNPQTQDIAEVRLHASSTAPGGCGAYDPAAPVFNNPTTYTLTLDAAAQEMSTFRLDLLDFDTFEGITGLNPIPSRVEGDVTWNGSTITANVSNATAYAYWDNPPAQISYRYGNTGGGLACSAVAFQGMTLVPEGCCGCDAAERCRDTSSTLLCDTAAADLITVFDPATRPDADDWEVVSFTGARPDAPPEAPLPYPARYGTPYGYPALGARADQYGGYGGGSWAGYDSAPVRWVIRKTFEAPEDGVAVAQSIGFRGDGGARVRINGQDAGMYGQWNQPATSGTAEIPVTAGANTVEIEVRDVNGINNVVGRLDIALPKTVQFMRRQTVDCETGEVIATHDTTLDGEPYTVVGEVGECQPVAECCEQAPPETRVDVETQLLCVRDTATGEVLDQVLVERVYDDQTGDLISQRLTDPTTTDPVTLPAGAEIARCPSPDRITRQICVAASGAAEFLTNEANAASGQDTDWTWSPSPTGPWHPMYRVAPNPVWTATDTAPNPAHWVSPHADRTVCPTAG